MNTTYSPDTGKRTWGLTRWYEKTIYVIGFICTIYFAIAFMVGFVIGLMGALVS
jgi:hypothetical protein